MIKNIDTHYKAIDVETGDKYREPQDEGGGDDSENSDITLCTYCISPSLCLHLGRQTEQEIAFALAGCNEAVEG